MNPQNIDINQCVKEVQNFLATDYVNICTGTTTTVPRGSFDLYAPFIFLAFMCIVALVSFRVLNGSPTDHEGRR